jgi:hypothetical protein
VTPEEKKNLHMWICYNYPIPDDFAVPTSPWPTFPTTPLDGTVTAMIETAPYSYTHLKCTMRSSNLENCLADMAAVLLHQELD